MKMSIKTCMISMTMFFIIPEIQAQLSSKQKNTYHLDSVAVIQAQKQATNSNKKVSTSRKAVWLPSQLSPLPNQKKERRSTKVDHRNTQKKTVQNQRTTRRAAIARDHRPKNQSLRFDEADALFGKRTNVRDNRN